ncbi:MAG: TonB family protein [Sheuella sp.]|nr:TonB family protein [Sheuella sp.]
MNTPSLPPSLTPSQIWRQSEQRFLRWAIGLSILFHLGLLAWHRHIPSNAAETPQTLEVVMVNAATELSPTQAKLLAQNNMDGGGQADLLNASQALPRTGDTGARIEIESLTKKQMQLESEQQNLLTRMQSSESVSLARTTPYFMKESNAPGMDDKDRISVLQNAKLAILSQQVQDYNQRPRKHFDAPSTQAIRYAPYIDQWRQRVEQIGAQHYPHSSGKTLYGKVQATLTIRSNGTLSDITIDRPSDQPVLNQSVLRIAQLSAPFAPFPPDMAKEIDQLVLTRTWHFVNGILQTREP